jgi:arylsulfatase
VRRARKRNGFHRWYLERMFIIAPAGAFVGRWPPSFKEFPAARRLHFCRRAAGGT